MTTGRASKKLVPRDKRGWASEYYGILEFLAQTPQTRDPDSLAWFKRMKQYYRERKAVLEKNAPRGMLPKKE